jgi:hypothetical protein
MLHDCHSPSDTQAGVVAAPDAGVAAESPRGEAGAAGDWLATGDALEAMESVRAGDSP